jgi:hypothetical protein
MELASGSIWAADVLRTLFYEHCFTNIVLRTLFYEHGRSATRVKFFSF